MRPRYPSRWLMTDERMGDRLTPTLLALPPGSGVVFRHYSLAERERRAKIIDSEGEFQAAAKLLDAAELISRNPATIQLRYLQTLLEIGTEQNSTIVFPLPIDMLAPFLPGAAEANGSRARV